MKRIVLLIAVGFAFAGTGCDKSPDHGRKAELASAGNKLMPGPAPTYEEIYVVDQAQVKSAPKRTVSYEPLESFGSEGGKKIAPAEATEEESPKSKKNDGKASAPKTQKAATPKRAAPKAAVPSKSPPATAKSPARPPSGSSGSFWKNVGAKALMGGGPAAKPAPPQSGKEKPKAAKSEEEADDEKSADDEEEKSDDEEKDSDEEGDESGKDEKKDDDGG